MIHAVEITQARERIMKTFAARSADILTDSELWFVLEEMRRFSQATRDQRVGNSDSETDDLAVGVASDLLRGIRLDCALLTLSDANVPHIVETLRTLASFKHGNPQHRLQFDQSEYELHMASQFEGLGQRVSFVDTRRTSHYKQRVEFMVGYKWPVECKLPLSKRRVIPNIDAALKKLAERDQAGLICIALEQALPMAQKPYLEVVKSEDPRSTVSQHIEPWFSKHKDILANRLQQSCGRFIIFSYSVLTYVHDSECVAMPSLRLALGATGDWIERDVIETCVRHLKQEREQAKLLD
jgi:hypothetical protein